MNPLDQLKDIKTASTVDWWPLSWGWWVLIGVVVMLIIVAGVYCWKRYRFNHTKRQAIASLMALDVSDATCAQQINGILKRVTLAYFDPQHSASLHGAQWINFLLAQLPNSQHKVDLEPPLSELQSARFKADTPSEASCIAWRDAALRWLKHADLKCVYPQVEVSHV